MQNKKLNNE